MTDVCFIRISKSIVMLFYRNIIYYHSTNNLGTYSENYKKKLQIITNHNNTYKYHINNYNYSKHNTIYFVMII